MAPWYKRKKVWIGIATVVGLVASRVFGMPELQEEIVTIGGILIAAFGLEDMGKAKAVLGAKSDTPPNE